MRKLRLNQSVAFVLVSVLWADRGFAQTDECVAQFDACIESAVIPDEVRESERLRDELWQILMRGRESGEAYFIEEVGLRREAALTLTEYTAWAIRANNVNDDALKAHYCGLLEAVTTGPELNELYQRGWDWEQQRIRERHRLATGVFAVLADRDSSILLAYLDDLVREPHGISGSAPLVDIDTWSPERVARIKWIACEMPE